MENSLSLPLNISAWREDVENYAGNKENKKFYNSLPHFHTSTTATVPLR